MSKHTLGYLLLSLAMMTVGSTVIASKIIAPTMGPFLATALRFAFALPVLAALMLFKGVHWPRLSRRDWGLLVLQAGAGSVGYTTLLITGLVYLPASDAGVVIGTLPAVSALFSVFVLGERPQARILLSVLLATVGVMAVGWKNSSTASLIGMLCILGAVACESIFILLNKCMQLPLPPLQQATAMTGLGLLVSLPIALFELPEAWPGSATFAAIAWYALVPTVGGFLLWYAGSARVSGSEAATFTAVAPLTAVALAVAMLDEALAWSQAVGVLSVILAILVLTFPTRLLQRQSHKGRM